MSVVVVSATALRCRRSCFGNCMGIKLMTGWNDRSNAPVKITSSHCLLEKTLLLVNYSNKWELIMTCDYYMLTCLRKFLIDGAVTFNFNSRSLLLCTTCMNVSKWHPWTPAKWRPPTLLPKRGWSQFTGLNVKRKSSRSKRRFYVNGPKGVSPGTHRFILLRYISLINHEHTKMKGLLLLNQCVLMK